MSTSNESDSRYEVDDTIEDRVSVLISNALGEDYEDNFSFNDDDHDDVNEEYDYEEEIRSKITITDKLRQRRNDKKSQSLKNKHKFVEPTGECFQIGDTTINEAQARLHGLGTINDIKKKFLEKKDNCSVLPEPKSEHFANLQKNKNFKSNKREDIFSKEDDRKNCTFKPKGKTAAQLSAAKAAGFGGNNANDIGANGTSGGFQLKEETERDRELEREKAFCRRQDAFINAKNKELERVTGEVAYDYVLDSDKKRCPKCGNIQTYEEILKKEKKCRGETCESAAYVRGATFHAKTFLKRQEEHQQKSEAQLKLLTKAVMEEDMGLNSHEEKFTIPVSKIASNTSAVSTVNTLTAAQNVDKTNNVSRDLRQPRYLSKTTKTPTNRSVLKETRGNNGNTSRQQGHGSTINEVNCDLQMIEHLETIVGKEGTSQEAHRFVADTYNKMMKSEVCSTHESTNPSGLGRAPQRKENQRENKANRTYPTSDTRKKVESGGTTKASNKSYDNVKHEERRKTKSSNQRSTTSRVPVPVKKSKEPSAPPPNYTPSSAIPTLSRRSSYEQPIGRVKSGPVDIDPWASLLY